MKDTPEHTTESTSETQPISYLQDVYNIMAGRSSWNIEMEFYELTEKAIVLRIVDYDNIGYAYNDLYYWLDIYEDGEWKPIFSPNKNGAMKDVMYHVPSRTENYCDLLSFNMRQFLPEDFTLKTGHYRITKILSGKEFSLEFDLTVEK